MKKKLYVITLSKEELKYIVELLMLQEAGYSMFKSKKKERKIVKELLDRITEKK
jgi:hypothetical protein